MAEGILFYMQNKKQHAARDQLKNGMGKSMGEISNRVSQ
jgi:hypothetical protein